MRNNLKSSYAAAAAVGLIGMSSVASASSHREAPGIAEDPVADSTDLWAWHTGAAGSQTLHIVACYNPLEEPAGGPNFHSFGDDVLYEIHIARGSSNLNDVITYQLRFSTSPATYVDPGNLALPLGNGKEFFSQLSGRVQTYSLTEVKGGVSTVLVDSAEVAPANIGPRTNTVAYGIGPNGTYEDFARSKAETFFYGGADATVWAGPRDDGFYVDLGGVFDLANLRAAGVAQDGVSGFNVHAIVLDIPVAAIPTVSGSDAFANRFGIWTSASRRKLTVLRNDGTKQGIGPWVQVSRLGLPLINEVIIGLQDKDKYGRTHPKDDVANFGAYILNPVIVRDADAVGIYAALGVPQATVAALSTNRADIVSAMNILSETFPLTATGDVLRVDLGSTSGFPNGRPLGSDFSGDLYQENDVTDVLSTLVLAGAANLLDPNGLKVSDGVSYNDAPYFNEVPYLPTPHVGYDGGHGKPNID